MRIHPAKTAKVLGNMRGNGAKGFALIVTLSLMILLTVIAVGLLALSSISLRSTAREDAMSQARSNARLALMLALGDLQELAGPDQRVSARADIIKSDIKKPHITGVWESLEIDRNTTDSDYSQATRNAKFRGWLTSGTPLQIKDLDFADAAPLALTAQANGKSPLALDLWDKGSVSAPLDPDAPANNVRVNKIEIASPPGALAWAVMDEGVKARINTHYTDQATSTGLKTATLGTGERPGAEFITGLSGLKHSFYESSTLEAAALDKGISRLNFSYASRLIAGNTLPESLKILTHDVTPYSLGLFTNTARGGLREDFCLLSNADTLPAVYKDKGIYDSVLGVSGPSDPAWNSLQEFATIYKAEYGTSGPLLGKIGKAPLLKFKVPSNWSASTGSPTVTVQPTPPPGVLLLPTIAKVQMLFSLIGRDIYPNLPDNILEPLKLSQKTNMHGPQDGHFRNTRYDYDLHLLYTPIITLHNPYNVALELSSLRLEFVGVPFSMQVFRNGVPLSNGLVPFESMTIDNQHAKNTKLFAMNLKSKASGGNVGEPTFRMLPGEVLLFSPYINPDTTYAADLRDKTFWDIYLARGLTGNISAIPGWRGFGIGYDCDWLAGNQAVSGDKNLGHWAGCYGLAWDDRIHVEFAAIGVPSNNNKFIVQMSAEVPGSGTTKVSAIEIDYDTLDGLQNFLTENGAPEKMRYPRATDNPSFVYGYELRDSSQTPIKSIRNAKPFALLTAQAKNTSSGSDSSNLSGRFAAKPWSFAHGGIGTSVQKIANEHSANHSHELDLLAVDVNDAQDMVSVDEQDRSRFISGNRSNDNSTKFGTLYDIPLTPVQTLAGLNGANPGGSSGYLPRFAQPIGNSWAHPLISPTKFIDAGASGYNYLDHSFLLNLALYDGFYFSGLADQTGTFGTGRTSSEIADSYAAGTPLDDPRLVFLPPAGKSASEFARAITQPNAYTNIAAWQAMEGAFNVNSTSVQAWKAMLASIHDAEAIVNQRDKASAKTTDLTPLKDTSAARKTRISRFRLPGSISAADGANNVKDAYWLGPREYTDAQLQILAETIVKIVRERGPFLSMADFVNRQLGPESDVKAQKGALQQAIDESEINQSIAAAADAGYQIPASAVANYKYNNPTAGTGPSYQGAPGYLTQADILNVLGNAATVRSDTFTIRGYGEYRDASGKLVATATCEAVVQRVLDWVDPADSVSTPVAELSSASNRTFGRRFVVSSFRWLSSTEI